MLYNARTNRATYWLTVGAVAAIAAIFRNSLGDTIRIGGVARRTTRFFRETELSQICESQ